MPSNRTPTRFYGPAQTTGATVYTVPASKIAVIRKFTAMPHATDYILVGVVVGVDNQPVLYDEFASSGPSKSYWEYLVLTAGETLYAESGGNVTLTINGDLYDA